MQGHTREVRRCAARPRSRTAIGPRMLTMIVVVVGLALAVVSAASGQPQRASAQPQWIVFTAQSSGLGVEQIFRITVSGEGLKQLTKGSSPSAAPRSRPTESGSPSHELGAGIFSMNLDGTGVRRLTSNGRDNLPAWSPDGKQIAFLRPSANGWGVYVMSASGTRRAAAPPGACSRPAVLDRPRARDSDRGRPRPDRSSNPGACSRRFGATIDAIVGMNATAVSPDLSTHHVRRRRTAGSRGQGLRRRHPLSAVRALHRGSQQAQGAANSRPRCRTGVVLARREEPGVRGSESDRPLASSRTARRDSIKTGKLLPTVASPPVWQPR